MKDSDYNDGCATTAAAVCAPGDRSLLAGCKAQRRRQNASGPVNCTRLVPGSSPELKDGRRQPGAGTSAHGAHSRRQRSLATCSLPSAVTGMQPAAPHMCRAQRLGWYQPLGPAACKRDTLATATAAGSPTLCLTPTSPSAQQVRDVRPSAPACCFVPLRSARC